MNMKLFEQMHEYFESRKKAVYELDATIAQVEEQINDGDHRESTATKLKTLQENRTYTRGEWNAAGIMLDMARCRYKEILDTRDTTIPTRHKYWLHRTQVIWRGNSWQKYCQIWNMLAGQNRRAIKSLDEGVAIATLYDGGWVDVKYLNDSFYEIRILVK